MYEYLIGNLLFLALWLVLYLMRDDLQRKMVFSSFLCLPLGLSDYFFIPKYWNPETLFNFRPGIESLIFAFAIGGIASVLYETVLDRHLKKARETRVETRRHLYALAGVLVFSLIFFSFILHIDLIYSGSIAMVLGAATIMLLRRDLIKETIIGGILFLAVHFVLLFVLDTLIFPGIIAMTWNFENLLGITFLNIPLEEIIWALAFGSLWAPIYEDLKGYTAE